MMSFSEGFATATAYAQMSDDERKAFLLQQPIVANQPPCPECDPAGIVWPDRFTHVRHHLDRAKQHAEDAIRHAADAQRHADEASKAARRASRGVNVLGVILVIFVVAVIVRVLS